MDFDPDTDPETQEDATAYVRWCAEQFNRVASDDSTPRTYRSALRASTWLWVPSAAMLHLDDSVIDNREAIAANLAKNFQMARMFERQVPGIGARELVVARSVADCWAPVGRYAPELLEVSKYAIAARLLIESHLLDDVWELDAPDVWGLILLGGQAFTEVSGDTVDDYAVVPNQATIDKMTWQKVGNLAASLGATPPSPN